MKQILWDAIEIVEKMNARGLQEKDNENSNGEVHKTSTARQISLARPLHNEPCMDVNCTDFLQYCKWRTELCPSWQARHRCKMLDKCVYAHGGAQLRPIRKLRLCNAMIKHGYCAYGERVSSPSGIRA